MAGNLKAGELTARVDALHRRVGDGANVDEALVAEVDGLAATAESERDVDQSEARAAATRHAAVYGPYWNSALNPYNWITDTEGRAHARATVWPLDAEVAEDEAQLARVRGIQETIDKHTMGVEQRELIENARALRNQLGTDVGAALAQTMASTGMSRGDAIAAFRVFNERFGSDTSAELVGALARVNQEAGATPPVTSAEMLTTSRWFYDQQYVGSDAAPTLAETFYTRLQAARRTGGDTNEAQIRASVMADYRSFYAIQGAGSATSAVLTSLVGSHAPTRESVADHFKWFYAQRSIGESSALVMTALVAPYDGMDTRDAEERRREVLADLEVVNNLKTSRGSLSSDNVPAALAAYRDPNVDFTQYMLLVWFFTHVFDGSSSTAFAGAATERFRRTDTASRIGQVSAFQVRTPRTSVPTAGIRVGSGSTRAPVATGAANRSAAVAGSTASRAAASASSTASRAAANASATASRAAAQASATASRASASAARSSAASSGSGRR